MHVEPRGSGPIGAPAAPEQLYESAMLRSRDRLSTRKAMSRLLAPTAPPELLECFLIHFCAFGVKMTEPVEGWIRKAGDRCEALGHAELGKSLKAHARHEAGHHQLMIDDTRRLVERWNAHRTPKLDADAILALPTTPGPLRYAKLHEQTIAGDAPYGQLAIELEIEMLSIRLGPTLLGHVAKVLGPDILQKLSFVNEHVALDSGHTEFNKRVLASFLAEKPSLALTLAAAGTEALEAYGDFLDDAHDAAARVLGLTEAPASTGLVWSVQQGFSPTPGKGITALELEELKNRLLAVSGRRSYSVRAEELLARSPASEEGASAWHLVCRDASGPVLCVRLQRFDGGPASPFESLVAPAAQAAFWAGEKHPRASSGEVSRWLVTRGADQRLFARAIAGLWALARSLGLSAVYTWAGTRDGQASVLMRVGAKLVSSLAPVSSETFSDELCAVRFELDAPPAVLAPLIDDMGAKLGLR